jgi:hypothetical protein
LAGTIFNYLSSIKAADRTSDSYFDLINLLNSKLSTVASNEPFRNMSAAFRPGFNGENLSSHVYCEKPIPVGGQKDPAAPGYIVYFNARVDTVAETARLSNLYGFRPGGIYDALGGFYTSFFSPTLFEQLRCETSIRSIFYNARVVPNN